MALLGNVEREEEEAVAVVGAARGPGAGRGDVGGSARARAEGWLAAGGSRQVRREESVGWRWGKLKEIDDDRGGFNYAWGGGGLRDPIEPEPNGPARQECRPSLCLTDLGQIWRPLQKKSTT